MALPARVGPIKVLEEIVAQRSRRRAVALTKVALAQPPVVQDRDVGGGERHLRSLACSAQIRAQDRNDVVIASSPGHIGRIVPPRTDSAPG
jgi:hypothetical protein